MTHVPRFRYQDEPKTQPLSGRDIELSSLEIPIRGAVIFLSDYDSRHPETNIELKKVDLKLLVFKINGEHDVLRGILIESKNELFTYPGTRFTYDKETEEFKLEVVDNHPRYLTGS